MNSDQPKRPANYLALAIISTIICCLPAGIVSIVYATKVNTEYDNGNYEAAEKASKNAKTWGIVSIVAAAIVLIVYFLIFGFAIFAAAQDGGF